MKISVVIPVYNSMASIEALVNNVCAKLSEHLREIILVNDCSLDRSGELCEQLARRNALVQFISLRKNFGEHNAVMCGLNFVRGDAAVIIDDDFQNPPEEILKLMAEAEKGFDVVYSRYERKYHSLWRNLGSSFNSWMATALLGKPRGLYLSSFKLIRTEVVNEIIKYTGPFPYIDGLLLRVTSNIGVTTVEHCPRQTGSSNYTLRRLITLYLNMFLGFSLWPLRVFTAAGLAIFILGVVSSAAIILEKIFDPSIPLGWASMMVGIWMLSGVQITFLGLIAEYLGKQYLDQNNTPQWVIKKQIINPERPDRV